MRPRRPLAFNSPVHARRNAIKRSITRLKQWRGLATRFSKRVANYWAMVIIAAIVLWLDA